MSKSKAEIEISGDEQDIFVIVNGVKIAKRGYPGTPQAGTWVPLEPGWSVLDGRDGTEMEISYEPVNVQ